MRASSAYRGPFFATAEFLLRVVVKVQLSKLGYGAVWRSELWRIVEAAYEEQVER